MINGLPLTLLLSILLGAAVGFERESGTKSGEPITAGIRTFSLTCLLGALAGIFYVQQVPTVFIFIIAAFLLLLVASYVLSSLATKDTGLTSEISFVYIFLVGFLLTTRLVPVHLTVALVAVLMLVLAFKSKTQKILDGVSRRELESFISYAIIALVILPFLPHTGYSLSDIPLIQSLIPNLGDFAALELLNPRKIWFIVVLVTGVDVVGYVLSRFVGTKRGFTMTSFVGGFVSSTSTTQSLAQKSKTSPQARYLVGAAVLANLASLFQIFLLTGPLNSRLLVQLTPILITLILSGAVLSWFFLRKQNYEEAQQDIQKTHQKIFSLIPAVKFGLLIVVVQLATKVCLILFGESGFIISSIIASFAGLDAIVITLANLAGQTITFQLALITFLLVNATNLLSKSLYARLQGSRLFAKHFFVAVVIMIAASVFGLMFV